ncbi:hypothetical protein HU200_052813 [Digitaria exilis]|uniref:Uncharacterized protein n=1 Tax=Digitaria exilis TaxID=1010633 RepID=A0A835ALQ6_9POAL|nr:hypothetical protein HU200_052813 [Digitaria exilis]
MEGHLRQRQCSDTLAVAAAGDADPATEGHVGCPAAGEDSERISELSLKANSPPRPHAARHDSQVMSALKHVRVAALHVVHADQSISRSLCSRSMSFGHGDMCRLARVSRLVPEIPSKPDNRLSMSRSLAEYERVASPATRHGLTSRGLVNGEPRPHTLTTKWPTWHVPPPRTRRPRLFFLTPVAIAAVAAITVVADVAVIATVAAVTHANAPIAADERLALVPEASAIDGGEHEPASGDGSVRSMQCRSSKEGIASLPAEFTRTTVAAATELPCCMAANCTEQLTTGIRGEAEESREQRQETTGDSSGRTGSKRTEDRTTDIFVTTWPNVGSRIHQLPTGRIAASKATREGGQKARPPAHQFMHGARDCPASVHQNSEVMEKRAATIRGRTGPPISIVRAVVGSPAGRPAGLIWHGDRIVSWKLGRPRDARQGLSSGRSLICYSLARAYVMYIIRTAASSTRSRPDRDAGLLALIETADMMCTRTYADVIHDRQQLRMEYSTDDAEARSTTQKRPAGGPLVLERRRAPRVGARDRIPAQQGNNNGGSISTRFGSANAEPPERQN